MSEIPRDIVQLERGLGKIQREIAEHRHSRDPQWDGWVRSINHYGRTQYDDHFRSNAIPAGYAWQGGIFGGAPGGAGGILDYSYRGTYLRVVCDAQPHFLSRAVGAYANKWFVARCDTGYVTQVGIRADDGTDNNYCEFELVPQNDNNIRLTFYDRVGGGGVTTNAGPSVRGDLPYVIMLYYYSTTPAFWGYTSRESGRWDANTVHTTGAIAWVPSRIGLIFRGTVAGFSACVDLIYNEYI